MDRQELYKLDEMLYKQIQEDRKKKEAKTKAYFDGVEKGAEMMMKMVRDFLAKEEESAALKEQEQCLIDTKSKK